MKMISHFLMMLMLLHSGRVCAQRILAIISSLGKIIRLMSPHFKKNIYAWLKNPVLLYFLRRNRKRWRNPSFYPIPSPITEVISFFFLSLSPFRKRNILRIELRGNVLRQDNCVTPVFLPTEKKAFLKFKMSLLTEHLGSSRSENAHSQFTRWAKQQHAAGFEICKRQFPSKQVFVKIETSRT